MKRIRLIIGASFALIFGSFYTYLYFNYEVPIFMYHSVDLSKINTYAAVSSDSFQSQMDFIKRNGYKVISLKEYCQIIKENKPSPRKSVVLTFDDGYEDNLKATNILKKKDFPATIFIIVNKIGLKGYLSKDDINGFLDNTKVSIGSHTLNEVYLPDADDLQLQQEISGSKEKLEGIFGIKIDIFSYSIGGFNQKALSLVKASQYYCACTTNRGFSREIDPYALRRIKITDRDVGFKLWAKLSGFYNIFKKPKNPY